MPLASTSHSVSLLVLGTGWRSGNAALARSSSVRKDVDAFAIVVGPTVGWALKRVHAKVRQVGWEVH